ncbi:MAG: hypothetical protein Pg6C_11620 [Treponemataceae bacterium]|nr:MAG: hypothetical protein Pg6C_11620 [Treponemataceae bacterium]
MNVSFFGFGEKSLRGECLTRDECHQVLECPDEELEHLSGEVYKVRYAYKGDKVSVQILTNAKSGNCEQDCAYCAQSAAAHTGIAAYPLAPYETFARNGALAKEKGAGRHCIGLSGLTFTDAQIEELCGHVERLLRSADAHICCSIGFLTRAQAARLKKAGVSRINHNLNTGKNFYKNICTTHSYEERVANIRMFRELGFEICSGGIVAWGRAQCSRSSFVMPHPSSTTRIFSMPPPVISTEIFFPPASTALSSSSRTIAAGLSITSPAAIFRAISGASSRTGRRGSSVIIHPRKKGRIPVCF